ncbi:DUF397 domain-containing protein [Streptomyces sp.]|uniref:DUF397 domain-containing protein n=1 Tax=Streptomyces sp. TaxID=1931 RepID=UPI0039C9C74C
MSRRQSTATRRPVWGRCQGDSCVEIDVTEQAVHVRDSKDKDGPHLTIGCDAWARFVRFAAHG